MDKSRFLIITLIGFLVVLGETILKKTLVILVCGLLSFNSMACFFDWDYGRVNAARPNIEESHIAATPQNQSSAVIKSISKWWATAGKDKLIDSTLRIKIDQKGRYQLNINIGGAGLGSSEWGLTQKSEAILKSLESNEIIEEAKFGISGELTGKVEFSQELIPGNYEVKITNIEVPKKPIVEQFDFILNQKIRCVISNNVPHEIEEEKSRLKTLFIADRPEPNLDQSQINQLINKYAPILYFDKGELNEDKPELFPMPFSISETWGQHWGNKTPQITGSSYQSINLGQYTDNFTKGAAEPAVYEPAIYASISENPSESEIAINYYFHYPRSNWKLYGGFNTHQGDWEGITVFLTSFNLVPKRVAFSQHVKTPLSLSEGGMSVPWEYLEHPNNSNRTNVYVGLGAHASFPFRGITGFNSNSGVANQEFHKGDLSSFNPSPEQIHNLPRAESIQLGDRKEWLLFPGFWGDDGAAPRGPMFLDWNYEILGDISAKGDDEGLGTRWLDPWEWSGGFTVLTEGQNNINFWADQIIAIDTDLSSNEERSILRGGGSNDAYMLKAISIRQLKYSVSVTNTADGIFIQDRGGVDNLSILKDTSIEISLSMCSLERDGTALLINYDREGEAKYAEDVTVLDFFKNSTGEAEPGTGFIEEINNLTGQQIIDYLNNESKDKSCGTELAIDFCVKSATWTRHSESEQIKFLRSESLAAKYERASDAQLLKANLWTNDFLVYGSYYSASGAEENVRISGIWSLRDPKAFTDNVRGFGECNSDFASQPLIQIWAFSHDVKKVRWTGDRYLVTVKPTGQGFQMFQFPRQEGDLPKKVNPSQSSQNISPSEPPLIQIVDETDSTISICQQDPETRRILCR